MLDFVVNWLANTPQTAVPYALAALGLIISERAGVLNLTAEGRAMLKRLKEPVKRAEQHVLAAFTPAEQRQFLTLLDKFMRHFNADTRVPIHPIDQPASAAKPVRRRRGA